MLYNDDYKASTNKRQTCTKQGIFFVFFMSTPWAVQTLFIYRGTSFYSVIFLHHLPASLPPSPPSGCVAAQSSLFVKDSRCLSTIICGLFESHQEAWVETGWRKRRAVIAWLRHSVLWGRVSWQPVVFSSWLWLILSAGWQWLSSLTSSGRDDPDGQCIAPASSSPYEENLLEMWKELQIMIIFVTDKCVFFSTKHLVF